jgi:predicted metal-binding membrane protein
MNTPRPEPRPERSLFVAAALAFLVSAAGTVIWCGSMSGMPDMEMPGGWTMSMAWMRMPGQSWPGAALEFLGMWALMMVAMMLPVLLPMLLDFRRTVDVPELVNRLTIVAAAAYFAVWIIAGALVYPVGVFGAALAMESAGLSRAVPFAAGAVVIMAGTLQFSAWKARQLACCRLARRAPAVAGFQSAWLSGLRMGWQCVRCCAGLSAVLLVLGVMDLMVMCLVTAAIAAERLSTRQRRVARSIGVLLVVMGGILVVESWPWPP